MKKVLFVIVGIMLISVLSGCVNKQLLDSYENHLNVTQEEHMNYVKNGGKKMSDKSIKVREQKYKSSRRVIEEYREYADKWYVIFW